MRRVGVKRSNSEDIGSWDVPPRKRSRVEPSSRPDTALWARISSRVGGLLSSVRRWFGRRERQPMTSEAPSFTDSAPSSSPSPSDSPSARSSPQTRLLPPAPSISPPPPLSSPSQLSPPSFTAHTQSTAKITQSLPTLSARHSLTAPSNPAPSHPSPAWSRSSSNSRLWTLTEDVRPHSLTNPHWPTSRERRVQISSASTPSSGVAALHVKSPSSPSSLTVSPQLSPCPPLHPITPHTQHHRPHGHGSRPPESIGPKSRSQPLSSSLQFPGSAGFSHSRPPIAGSVTSSIAVYHPLPHSPPPSPLPCSDVVQRRKWVESVKADHTHSLSQHQAAVELELRHLAECRERRFRAEDSRVKHLQDTMHNMSLLSDFGREEDEEEEEEKMEALSEQQEQKVRLALAHGPGLQALSQKFNICIKRDDMRTLAGLNWLNDEVINFYMNLIMERSKKQDSVCRVHVMSSFFYPKLCDAGYSGVRRWTKKVDIFSVNLVLYPIHLGAHWCLAAVHNTNKTLSYYDSLGGQGTSCLRTLRDYLVAEHRDKKKEELSLDGWKDMVAEGIPLQKNGSDCGVFTCMYARYLACNATFSFSQEDMPQIRRHMVCELLEQKLF